VWIGKAIAIAADIGAAVLLLFYATVVGPLGVLRGPLAWERLVGYLYVFTPLKMVMRFSRMIIDWRLGHFDLAIAQGESLIRVVEQELAKKTTPSLRQQRVLLDLYVLMARAYLHAGLIDSAMQVVLRANRVLGADRLPGLSQLDAKTCHLVRAGLAAGRLLEGGGLTTLFVRTQGKASPASAPSSEGEKAKPSASATASLEKGGKVIPFPFGAKP